MKRKRLIAWGIIALVILVPVFLTIDKHRGYHPRMLEEMLSPMSGSLLSNDSSQFGIPGFEYGKDFPTTVKMLDLQEWFTEERVDSILGEMEQAKGQCNQGYGDSRFYFTAFGGKKYTLSFNLSKDLKCYMLEFACSFEDPKVIPAIIASNQELNSMTYEDSCQYFMSCFLRLRIPMAYRIRRIHHLPYKVLRWIMLQKILFRSVTTYGGCLQEIQAQVYCVCMPLRLQMCIRMIRP